MLDKTTTLDELKQRVKDFTLEREWQQFHSPKTLSQALCLEAAELMEHFLWCDNESSKTVLSEKRTEVEQEMTDVFWWLLQLAWQYDIDLTKAFNDKMALNKIRYSVEKAKGNTLKYTALAE